MVSPPLLQPDFQAQPPCAVSCASLSEEEVDTTEQFDDHGFALPPDGDAVGENVREYHRWFEPKALRRLGRFEYRRKRLPDPGAWSSVPKTALKGLLRKGVPHEHRKEVWCSVLGVPERMKASPSSYAEILAQARQEIPYKTSEEIERDLQRTFPNHRRFRQAVGQAELRNVLSAYAHHAPRVQYCQGINFIAALLLIVLEEEELSFWALVSAVETLGVERYYTEGMTLLRADMRTLGTLLEKKCPKVARRFAAVGVDLTSICSEWFITWYAKCMPISTTLRVWDAMFYEGFKVLFRVAVGIFKLVEADILKCTNFEDVMEQAKDWPRRMVNHNELLKTSFKGVPGLRRQDLLQVRDDALCHVEREDEEQKRRHQNVRERQALERAAREATKAAESKQQSVATGGAVLATAAALHVSGGGGGSN